MSSTSNTRTTSGLSQFSSCELSDALIKLSIPHGGHIPDIQLISPGRICSPAYTVKMVLASDTLSPKLTGGHFVDQAKEGHVVVIDAPPEAKSAVWGGLMSAGAIARGATGVVISGNCRDIGEHRKLSFPVYSRSHSTVGQSPFTRPSEVNVPLTIHPRYPSSISASGTSEGLFPAVTVNSGDWVVADEDGVVCVPRELEEKVIELAERGRAIDELCMRDIKEGKGLQASFKLHRG
ncbi:ribonuclease E inhibitor RraA/Dimethylmenaquinone methyltransferase [Ephemerocybe angulata]|uniref:Ribonuclease E inhibitor RraA/Dimethylmenaquinone methyltransferase n=1 Tax=Ephemerocybe angulata TaxID=980116 RepID=A0A8H6I9F6_9AGAR|nr:ribonuclease E inhibitor RraA/Dimethylmenaquinone methyltransferase [Tulosesus angulatus]